ncbi:MAG: hypothetical protein HY562_00310 [Ignavibacteriales bacterium]|nr:hypothetical protein [Ignavibacteriales bacterium]
MNAGIRIRLLSLFAFGGLMVFFLSTLLFSAWQSQDDTAWLKGSVDERFHIVAKHLRGFDMAMVETSHRYAELYWAGKDTNWAYADYQLKKIRTAVENGLERRPKRAASAQTFLTMVIPFLEEAIAKKDTTDFWNRFGAVTSSCNACHQNEKVQFIEVSPPKMRYSVVEQF